MSNKIFGHVTKQNRKGASLLKAFTPLGIIFTYIYIHTLRLFIYLFSELIYIFVISGSFY